MLRQQKQYYNQIKCKIETPHVAQGVQLPFSGRCFLSLLVLPAYCSHPCEKDISHGSQFSSSGAQVEFHKTTLLHYAMH